MPWRRDMIYRCANRERMMPQTAFPVADRSRPAGRVHHDGRRAGGLSQSSGAADHSVPARRQQRRGRPHDRRPARQAARQAGDHRQPRRRRRRDRHRAGGPRDARRLHHPRHFAGARGQPVALQAALRSDQSLRADRRDGLGTERRRGPSRPAGSFDQGTGGAGEAKARRPAIRLGRRRLLPASRRRAVQARSPTSTCCMCRSRAAGRR